MPRNLTGGLAFDHERTNNEGTGPTSGGHRVRQRRGEQYIYMVKCYNCNHYGHYSRDFPDLEPMEG